LAGATLTGLTTTGATMTGSDELAEVIGGMTVGTVSTSTSGAVAATTSTEFVTTGSGAAVVRTVPTAVGCAGRRITFIKADSGTTAGQIASTGGQTFGGAASPLTLATRYHGWTIESDGANWQATYVCNTVAPIAGAEKAAASGVASLSAGSLVVQNPASASATPAIDTIPITDHTLGVLAAGFRRRIVVDSLAATPYAVPASADTILGAATAGADQVANLPAADASLVGHVIRITKEDANAHNVVPTPNGANTIDGVAAAGASSTVTVQFGFVDLECVAAGAWRSMAARLA
jgi:hypothetical protein